MTIDLRLGRWQDVLADLPDGSVRLILTSPPYDNARTYEGTCEPVDFDELAAFGLRVLCPGGVVAMVLDGAVNDGAQSTTPYEVIVSWAKKPGWRFRQLLMYARDGVPGAWGGGWFRRDHEPLLYFIRDGAVPVCNKEAVRERTASYVAGHHLKRLRNGGVQDSGAARYRASTVDRGSIWAYGNVGGPNDPSCKTGHPATFAEAFALDAVNVWSNPGDLVVDPFAGACTVGRACQILDRRFIGSERVPKYHEIGLRRLRDPAACERAAQEEAAATGQSLLFK